MKNIAKLKRIMDDYIDGKLPSIKIVLLEDFSHELGNILSLYEEGEIIEKEPEEKPMRPRHEMVSRVEPKHFETKKEELTEYEDTEEDDEIEETTIREIEQEKRKIEIKRPIDREEITEYEEVDEEVEDQREIAEDLEETKEREPIDTRPQFLKSIEKYYSSKRWDDDSEE